MNYDFTMRHQPVLLTQVLEYLNIKPRMNVIDCTLGDGGHSEAILERIAPKGMLLGIDADVESVLRAKRYLYRFENNFVAVRDNFVNLKQIIEKNNFKPINAILIDLGWSSPQFEERGKGLSFKNSDEPLDMRYEVATVETTDGTASDIVNNYTEEELSKIFRRYGEEKLSKEIAKAIFESRKKEKIEKVGDLVEIILQVYRKKIGTDKKVPWIGGLHPATKVFQALRIVVNNELEVLKQVLPQAVDILEAEGRLAVISFHSLEDRIVKHYFRSLNENEFKIITKKPVMADEEEVNGNVRARSAKMRVVEKI